MFDFFSDGTLANLISHTWKLLTLYASFGAFIVALSALFTRDPSLREDRSGLPIRLVLIGIAIGLCFSSLLITGAPEYTSTLTTMQSRWGNGLLWASAFPFAIALLSISRNVLRVHVSLHHLREDKLIRYSSWYKWMFSPIKRDIDYVLDFSKTGRFR